jgi:subtilisin
MKNSNTKRYLVTYADGSISASTASEILGVSQSHCKDGVAFMATEATPDKEDVLHFESLGISSVELTSAQADELSHSEKILAVEEDYEMYALDESETDETQFKELFVDSEAAFDFDKQEENTYDQGYDQALLDMFLSILKNRKNGNTDSNAANISPIIPPRFRFDRYIPSIPRQPVPWNIALVKAPQAWARGINGTGVKIAVLDSGVSSHPDLVISGGVSFVPGETTFNDLNGHGTHVAGTIAARNNFIGVVGVAPNAMLYAVKVLQHNPSTGRASGSSSWIIAGMEWCINNGIKVANMSLGGTNAPSVAYANAVKRCQDNGVTVVIASGNSFGTSFPWVCAPANSVINNQLNASPIAVGAVNSSCQIAAFSSRGGQTSPWNQVTCVAPGVSVNSTHLNGAYRSLNGTSMACPHVAGLAALIIQRYPGITPANVKRRISLTSVDLGPAGQDQTFGYGLINCDLATR